jgi:hypothetical protein
VKDPAGALFAHDFMPTLLLVPIHAMGRFDASPPERISYFVSGPQVGDSGQAGREALNPRQTLLQDLLAHRKS